MRKLIKFFKLEENKTKVSTEIFAGLAIFLATAYILTVNPNNILVNGSADPRFSSVFIATALGAFIGSLLMAFVAKMPLAQAPGMGINALVGAIVGGSLGISYSLGNVLFLIFISGILFILFSVINIDNKPIREKVFEGMPKCIRDSISVGIGLFIAFIGLKNASIITGNQFTLVELIDFGTKTNWVLGGPACQAIVALFGLIVITVLSHFKVKGSVIIGILSATLLSIPLKVADLSILVGNVPGISWNIFTNLKSFFSLSGNSTFLTIFKEGMNIPQGSLFTSLMLVISFSMVDMFDTIGTVVACTTNAGLVDKEGKPLNYGKIMLSDSLATCIGAMLGTTTITTVVESGAGVAEGGKTGLTSFTTAILFLLSIFLLPLFAFIPIAASASALIYVGALMLKNITKVDLKNIRNSVPAFLTIILMPLTYSITDGIGLGIIAYFLINLIIYIINRLKGKNVKSNITLVNTIITILFIFYFLIPTM
jgi:adenine/guanine/hypoxanthine permease